MHQLPGLQRRAWVSSRVLLPTTTPAPPPPSPPQPHNTTTPAPHNPSPPQPHNPPRWHHSRPTTCCAVTTTVAQPNSPNSAWKLPINGFGPFGPTGKCVGDAWPNGHCGLKKTATPGKPIWWDMLNSRWLGGFSQGCLRACTPNPIPVLEAGRELAQRQLAQTQPHTGTNRLDSIDHASRV
jgi:hypothetical protein